MGFYGVTLGRGVTRGPGVTLGRGSWPALLAQGLLRPAGRGGS